MKNLIIALTLLLAVHSFAAPSFSNEMAVYRKATREDDSNESIDVTRKTSEELDWEEIEISKLENFAQTLKMFEKKILDLENRGTSREEIKKSLMTEILQNEDILQLSALLKVPLPKPIA